VEIKVISWNIWQDYHLDEVITYLKQGNADIIGIQEVIEKNGTNTGAIIAGRLGYECAYYRAIEKTRLGFPQGNAILSRYPITKSTSHMLSTVDQFTGNAESEPRVAVETHIDIMGTQVTVITTHLAYSYMFQESAMRNLQVDKLLSVLPKAKTILIGDFNSHPDSSYMKKLTAILQNTDKDLIAPTWTVYPFDYEGFHETELKHRLDYIFVTRDISVTDFRVEPSKGSDHLPIAAVLKV